MKKWEQDIRGLIIDLSVIKNRAMELKMYTTYHLLDDALNRAGWELAEKLDEDKEKD